MVSRCAIGESENLAAHRLDCERTSVHVAYRQSNASAVPRRREPRLTVATSQKTKQTQLNKSLPPSQPTIIAHHVAARAHGPRGPLLQ
jgi:hypothetical protein